MNRDSSRKNNRGRKAEKHDEMAVDDLYWQNFPQEDSDGLDSLESELKKLIEEDGRITEVEERHYSFAEGDGEIVIEISPDQRILWLLELRMPSVSDMSSDLELLETLLRKEAGINEAIDEVVAKFESGEITDSSQNYTVKWMKKLNLHLAGA